MFKMTVHAELVAECCPLDVELDDNKVALFFIPKSSMYHNIEL